MRQNAVSNVRKKKLLKASYGILLLDRNSMATLPVRGFASLVVLAGAFLVIGCGQRPPPISDADGSGGGGPTSGLGRSPAEEDQRRGLRLRLSQTNDFDVSDFDRDVLLEVEIANQDRSSWVIYPGFQTSSVVDSRFPTMKLQFVVKDEKGNLVPQKEEWFVDTTNRKADPRSLLVLPVGSRLGFLVPLDGYPFGYDFAQPGRYQVNARLTVVARSWLLNALEVWAIDPDELHYSPNQVFEGELESDSIEIVVAPP